MSRGRRAKQEDGLEHGARIKRCGRTGEQAAAETGRASGLANRGSRILETRWLTVSCAPRRFRFVTDRQPHSIAPNCSHDPALSRASTRMTDAAAAADSGVKRQDIREYIMRTVGFLPKGER